IITDSNSLVQTLKNRNASAKIARWSLFLENYDYTIQHRSGSSMAHVHALSRTEAIGAIRELDIDFQLQLAQSRDPTIESIKSQLELENLPGYVLPPTRTNNQNIHSIPKAPQPFDTLHIDHLGPLPLTKSKKKYILVVIDTFTKFTKLYATRSTGSQEVCNALKQYISYYSRPKRIISDPGTCFTSNQFESATTAGTRF
uniref:Integrase catalytic domain-containing protein n=1 Tax=Anopheles quadriannulatus TaxID=34691 RepID=A0A182XQ23_ANOQN